MFESFVKAEIYKIVKNNTKGYCLFNKKNGTCALLQSDMYFINTAAKAEWKISVIFCWFLTQLALSIPNIA